MKGVSELVGNVLMLMLSVGGMYRNIYDDVKELKNKIGDIK